MRFPYPGSSSSRKLCQHCGCPNRTSVVLKWHFLPPSPPPCVSTRACDQAEVYRTFADLAAKQSRRHSPTAELLLPAPVEQPKQVSSGGEKQHALLSPPLASTTVSERRSSGGPLGTIPEEVSEEVSTDGGNSPTPAVSTSVVVERTLGGPLRTIPEEYSGDEGSPVPVASTAAAAKVADRSIWKETIGSDEPAEADEHRFEEPEGGGSDANNVVLNPPAQDAGQDEIRENTLASDDDGVVAYVPAPRVPAGVIPIGFSTRLFPTPLRESKVADESAWIMKNRRHLHKNKTLVGRLPSEGEQEKDGDINFDISESDPVWLKGKGDDLYRGGDFLGAINAYTAALEADPKAAACLSNRAACHLRLDQISACVADCGAALEIFRTLPETGPNQARVLVRRSLAYRELGHYKLSLNDCRAALGFNPGDTVLQRETARAEPLALCEAAKKEAVAHFASGDIAGACELYTAALAAVPAFPSCLSNRAVCYLALGKPQDCVRDCTAVLDMLSAGPSAAGLRANARRSDPPPKDPKSAGRGRALVPPPGSMPPPGSVKRRRWVLTTMLRRARANVQLGCLESALQDYRAASSLAPGDKAIEGDVRELERQLNSDAERRPLTH